MTKQYIFRGTREECAVFKVECGRLRIETTMIIGEEMHDIIAMNLTDRQFKSVHNLAQAIILK